METVTKNDAGGSAKDIDTFTSLLGKKSRTPEDAMNTGGATNGTIEKRPRGEGLEMALSADVEVAGKHAQWWNPALKPQEGATHSWIELRQHGLKMNATERWVGSDRRKKRNIMPNSMNSTHGGKLPFSNEERAARSRSGLRKRSGFPLGRWRMDARVSKRDLRPRATRNLTFMRAV